MVVLKANLLEQSTSQQWAFIANALWLKQYVTFGTKQHCVQHFNTKVSASQAVAPLCVLKTRGTNQEEHWCHNFKVDERMDQK